MLSCPGRLSPPDKIRILMYCKKFHNLLKIFARVYFVPPEGIVGCLASSPGRFQHKSRTYLHQTFIKCHCVIFVNHRLSGDTASGVYFCFKKKCGTGFRLQVIAQLIGAAPRYCGGGACS